MMEADNQIATGGKDLRASLFAMEEPLRRLRRLTEALFLAAAGAHAMDGARADAFTGLAEAMEAEGEALADAWRAASEASRSA
ncbi:MAG: hypothetical protein QJR07_20020 [Acetobacteraceae bacterium]|nr:hypothetical protein [Acetobacteraceae bacterium]